MRSFTYAIHIDRRPEQVWDFMLDFNRAPRWRNLVRRIDVLTPGPLRVGSELNVTFDIMGKTRTVISEVHAFEPGRRFGVHNTEQNVTGFFEYTLEPDATGTTVRLSCDIKPRGWMWLVLPLMLRSSRMRYAQQLPNLKQELERAS